MTARSASIRVRDFHGVRVGYDAGPDLARALEGRIGAFPLSDEEPHLLFRYGAGNGRGRDSVDWPAAGTRPIYDSAIAEVLYSDELDWIRIRCRGIQVDNDPSSGLTTYSGDELSEDRLWLATHPLFTLPFIEGLKRRGRYSVHAAAVASRGKAVLFPGTSGCGKSTLAVAMAREGLDFLGDDMIFLSRGQAGPQVLAFPELVDLTEDTVRLFPEMHYLLAAPPLPGWPKRQVRVGERFGARTVLEGRPVALVFPRVAHAVRSVLEPMDAAEALLELAPNILLTEATASQAHLDALTELVAVCACYRLHTGSDFGVVAETIRDLLDEYGDQASSPGAP